MVPNRPTLISSNAVSATAYAELKHAASLPLVPGLTQQCLSSHAQASRPKMKRWIDSFGEVYSKAIIAVTIVILIALPMMGVPMLGTPTQRGAFYRAMGFLTTASPCALVLVPLAYVSAIGAVTSRLRLLSNLAHASGPCGCRCCCHVQVSLVFNNIILWFCAMVASGTKM